MIFGWVICRPPAVTACTDIVRCRLKYRDSLAFQSRKRKRWKSSVQKYREAASSRFKTPRGHGSAPWNPGLLRYPCGRKSRGSLYSRRMPARPGGYASHTLFSKDTQAFWLRPTRPHFRLRPFSRRSIRAIRSSETWSRLFASSESPSEGTVFTSLSCGAWWLQTVSVQQTHDPGLSYQAQVFSSLVVPCHGRSSKGKL